MLSFREVILMRIRPFYVSVRELANVTPAHISWPALALQELLEIALFWFYVRSLASPTSKENESMKRLLMSIALTSALSMTTLAGEIPSGGAPEPQPQTAGPSLLGDIPSGDNSGSLSDAAISAILSALGLASI